MNLILNFTGSFFILGANTKTYRCELSVSLPRSSGEVDFAKQKTVGVDKTHRKPSLFTITYYFLLSLYPLSHFVTAFSPKTGTPLSLRDISPVSGIPYKQ